MRQISTAKRVGLFDFIIWEIPYICIIKNDVSYFTIMVVITLNKTKAYPHLTSMLSSTSIHCEVRQINTRCVKCKYTRVLINFTYVERL
jgi:hypothetical protein